MPFKITAIWGSPEAYSASATSSAIGVAIVTLPHSCNSDYVDIKATASGGDGNYGFIWSNGNSGSILQDISAGSMIYYLTVTDGDCCSTSASVTVPYSLNLTASLTVQANSTCFGSGGVVDVLPGGGTPPYIFQWSNGQATQGLVNVSAGTYFLTLTDYNHCTTLAGIGVSDGNLDFQPSIVSAGTNPAVCNNTNTLPVVTTTGGTGINYSWTLNGALVTYSTNSTFSYGNYALTITDASNCKYSHVFALTPGLPDAQLIVTPATACLLGAIPANGAISIANPNANETYSWSYEGNTSSSINQLPGVAPGTPYSVTITNTSTNCSAVGTAVIIQPGELEVSVTPTASTCGLSNGSITCKVTSGGTPCFNYAWTTNAGATVPPSQLTTLASGNYYCIVSDANNCQLYVSATVGGPQPMTGNATVTNVTCFEQNNGSITLQPSGGTPFSTSPNYHYAWSNNATAGDVSSVNNLSPGTYTVTVSDNASCSITLSFTITQPSAALEVSLQSNTSCTNGGPTETASVSGGTSAYSYTWSISQNGANFSSIIVPAIGTYTLTVTDANGCSATGTNTIIALDAICCINTGYSSNGIEIISGSESICGIFTPNMPCPTGILTTNHVFVIEDNATLTIDRNTIIGLTEIILGGGAQIIVDGVELQLLGTYIHGCDNMWEGIKVINGGTIVVGTGGNNNTVPTYIEDAQIAIELDECSNFSLSNTYFTNDYVGVHVACSNLSSYTAYIGACNFSSTTLKPPHAGEQTSIGIDLYNGNSSAADPLVIGYDPNYNPTGLSNTFNNIRCGINNTSGSLVVYQNTFENINSGYSIYNAITCLTCTPPPMPPIYYGKAIYAKATFNGPYTNVGDESSATNATFNYCQNAIYLSNINANVYNNSIQNGGNGITSVQNNMKTLDFSGNFMNNVIQGITLNGHYQGAAFMNGNIINCPVPSTLNIIGVTNNPYGIYLTNFSCTQSMNAVVCNNTITEGANGIHLLNTGEGCFIRNNTISFTSTTPQSSIDNGINIESSQKFDVSTNTVTGNGPHYVAATTFNPSAYAKRGIALNNNYFSSTRAPYKLTCNPISNIGYGIYVQSLNENYYEYINQNTFGDGTNGCYYGLTLQYLGNYGYIGKDVGFVNYVNDNIFSGPFTNSSSYQTYNFSSSVGNPSSWVPTFYWNGTSSPNPNGGNVSVNNILITALAEPSNPNPTEVGSCFINEDCLEKSLVASGSPAMDNLSVDELIASNQVTFSEFNDMSQYYAKWKIMVRAATDPAYLDSSATITLFYDSIQNTSMNRLWQFDSLMAVLTDSATLSDTAQYASQLGALQNNNTQIYSPEELKTGLNQIQVNNIYFNILTKGLDSITLSDVKFLYNLSQQCPYIEGSAVYAARSLIGLFVDTIFVDDRAICVENDDRSLMVINDTNDSVPGINSSFVYWVRLYNNPTRNKASLVYVFKQNEDGWLKISDAMGQQLLYQYLPANNQKATINVEQFIAGTYIVDVHSRNGFSKPEKLVIIR